MAVSGPNGYISDLSIEPECSRRFLGNDSYTAATDISDGSPGYEYQCNVTSFASNTGSVKGNCVTLLLYQKIYTRSFLQSLLHQLSIRASVDALCRDVTSEISRDPRTKRLQTRRESLAMPSKHTNNNF